MADKPQRSSDGVARATVTSALKLVEKLITLQAQEHGTDDLALIDPIHSLRVQLCDRRQNSGSIAADSPHHRSIGRSARSGTEIPAGQNRGCRILRRRLRFVAAFSQEACDFAGDGVDEDVFRVAA